jgi:hypothetical protein
MITLDELIGTIRTICASTLVREYRIGLSAKPDNRRRSYRDTWISYPHFVILETNLTKDQAVELERALQERVWKDVDCSMKYPLAARRHYRSTGGRHHPVYCIYMAWK